MRYIDAQRARAPLNFIRATFPALRERIETYPLFGCWAARSGGVTEVLRPSSSVTRTGRACALSPGGVSRLSVPFLALLSSGALSRLPFAFPRSGANLSQRVARPLVRREFGRGRGGARPHNNQSP